MRRHCSCTGACEVGRWAGLSVSTSVHRSTAFALASRFDINAPCARQCRVGDSVLEIAGVSKCFEAEAVKDLRI